MLSILSYLLEFIDTVIVTEVEATVKTPPVSISLNKTLASSCRNANQIGPGSRRLSWL
jgi:hypothetical protein